MRTATRILLFAISAGAVGESVRALVTIPQEVLLIVPERGRLPVEGELPSLAGATAWLNSPPLTPESLRGKVVLVDIWTYTCINWLRTLPYVRAWATRYKDRGLVVIGVHSPEFEFEKDLENVRRAVKAMRIGYPVAVDSDHALWRAFDNQYWPALYLIDAKGRVRYHQFGEGEYERTERVIQQLVAEAGAAGADRALTPPDAHGAEAAADLAHLKSGENYVGYERTDNFASPGGAVRGGRRVFAAPDALRLNQWALVGDWTVRSGAVVLEEAPGRIAYRFHARDLHLVMGPPTGGTPVRFRVLIDGKPPGAAHGVDVLADGNGTAGDQRLYQLIRQEQPVDEREFQIEFLEPGVEVFAFTFG